MAPLNDKATIYISVLDFFFDGVTKGRVFHLSVRWKRSRMLFVLIRICLYDAYVDVFTLSRPWSKGYIPDAPSLCMYA
jgi:hypothetical protein